MAAILEIREGTLTQGPLEEIRWSIDTSPRGGGPVNPDAKLEDVTYPYHEQLANDKLVGAATVDGDNVLTPTITGLVEDRDYLLTVVYEQVDGESISGRKEIRARIRCR